MLFSTSQSELKKVTFKASIKSKQVLNLLVVMQQKGGCHVCLMQSNENNQSLKHLSAPSQFKSRLSSTACQLFLPALFYRNADSCYIRCTKNYCSFTSASKAAEQSCALLPCYISTVAKLHRSILPHSTSGCEWWFI